VVSTTFEVTAYRTLWFGLQYDSETVEQGRRSGTARSRRCAGTTASRSATATCRDSSRPSKDVVGDMLDKGVFTPSTARQYLKQKLAKRVGDQQELRIPTGESPFETASQTCS